MHVCKLLSKVGYLKSSFRPFFNKSISNLWLLVTTLCSRALVLTAYRCCTPCSHGLSTDRRHMTKLSAQKKHCMFSDRSCKMTGTSLFILKQPVSFLACVSLWFAVAHEQLLSWCMLHTCTYHAYATPTCGWWILLTQ